MRIVDTKGQPCPAPIITTKRVLKDAKTGETFKVLTDSQTSLNNLTKFLKDNSTEFSVEDTDGIWTIIVTKKSDVTSQVKAEEYCTPSVPHFTRGNFIIAFTSDKMGEGNEELGHILMINFIKAVKELEKLPEKMIFYNNGVKLGSDGSPVLEHLKEIERMGVGILLCATCAKYYSLEDKIKVGSLSNMYEIAQVMASTGNVIKP
jgi:selenium metabolism protein YedF